MKNDFPEKILIIRLTSIGDILLSIPLILELRSRNPDIQIDFLVAKKYQQILDPIHSQINTKYCFDKNKKESREIRRIREIIRGKDYEWILDIHNSLRTKRLLFPINNKKIYRVNKFTIRRFLFVKFGFNAYPEVPVHQKYLNTAPIELSPTRSWYLDDYQNSSRQEQLLQEIPFLEKDKFNLVIFPGAKHRTKRWPLEKYLELIEWILQKTEWNIILSGDASDKQLLNSKLKESERIKNVCGEHDLIGTINLVALSDGVLSNDSGPMHIGAFLHKPQLAIFGNTVQEFGFTPLNNRAMIIENNSVDCRPCSHIGYEECPRGHFKCMKTISVQEVFQSTLKLEKMYN